MFYYKHPHEDPLRSAGFSDLDGGLACAIKNRIKESKYKMKFFGRNFFIFSQLLVPLCVGYFQKA
jgi:hypothetical protein